MNHSNCQPLDSIYILLIFFTLQARIVEPSVHDRNYSMFYELLAGLTQEEKAKFHLTPFTPLNLHYLSGGDLTTDPSSDKEHFLAWKVGLYDHK